MSERIGTATTSCNRYSQIKERFTNFNGKFRCATLHEIQSTTRIRFECHTLPCNANTVWVQDPVIPMGHASFICVAILFQFFQWDICRKSMIIQTVHGNLILDNLNLLKQKLQETSLKSRWSKLKKSKFWTVIKMESNTLTDELISWIFRIDKNVFAGTQTKSQMFWFYRYIW